MATKLDIRLRCADTAFGSHVVLTGSHPLLGCWDPHKGVHLTTSHGDFPFWRSDKCIVLPEDVESFDYKYVIVKAGKPIRWEERCNRRFQQFQSQSGGLSTLAPIQEGVPEGTKPKKMRITLMDTFNCTETNDCMMMRKPTSYWSFPVHNDQVHGPKPPQMIREESVSNMPITSTIGDNDSDDELASFEEEYALDDHLGPLGEGSFGVVWKCERKITGEKFAVKVIKRSRLTPIDLENLLGVDGEVALHRQLRHDNIVTLRSSYEDLKCVALVLNWCQGGDLFDLIVRHREQTGRGLPESVVSVAMSHVLSALKFIHQNKIVHRDVKCENILLEFPVDSRPPERNVYKLCDFGLARRILDGTLTDAAGSPDTVAPEMMHSGRPYSFPVDVWSCGVCAYMSLSAMPPFWGATDHAVMQRVKTGHYSTDGDNWAGISHGAKGFVHALMNIDPVTRVTAAQGLQHEWIIEHVGAQPPTPTSQSHATNSLNKSSGYQNRGSVSSEERDTACNNSHQKSAGTSSERARKQDVNMSHNKKFDEKASCMLPFPGFETTIQEPESEDVARTPTFESSRPATFSSLSMKVTQNPEEAIGMDTRRPSGSSLTGCGSFTMMDCQSTPAGRPKDSFQSPFRPPRPSPSTCAAPSGRRPSLIQRLATFPESPNRSPERKLEGLQISKSASYV